MRSRAKLNPFMLINQAKSALENLINHIFQKSLDFTNFVRTTESGIKKSLQKMQLQQLNVI